MTTTGDELAGVLDLFGVLTREELADALTELAFKQGEEVDSDAVDAAIERALTAYVIVEYDPAPDTAWTTEADATYLTVGPAAFPTLPSNAEDLPHILAVDSRPVDRERLATQVRHRLEADTEAAITQDNADRAAELHDISYDVGAWGPVDTDSIRASLSAVLPQD